LFLQVIAKTILCFVIPAIKKSAENSGLEPDNQILLLLEYSLRLAPSYEGVVVASSILCISTTLNKRNPGSRYILSETG
jgi:hypothetical protein